MAIFVIGDIMFLADRSALYRIVKIVFAIQWSKMDLFLPSNPAATSHMDIILTFRLKLKG